MPNNREANIFAAVALLPKFSIENDKVTGRFVRWARSGARPGRNADRLDENADARRKTATHLRAVRVLDLPEID